MCGARMLVIPDEVVYDPVAFTDLMELHKVTRIQFTPSLLSHIMASLDDKVLQKKLKLFNYVNLCGEVVTKKMVEKFNQLFPTCKLVNLYSISECHDAAQSVLSGPPSTNDLYGPSRSPKYAVAGKVIPNVNLHVLNGEREECPVGVFGEVYVSGPTVAIGYLNQPEQTAERFPPNPFQATTEPDFSRIYRTGDRGRFLPDGQLEVAGRIAFFIKIRGYSVVPSAIEATLSDHSDIATAVVLAVGDISSFDKKLVAYVLPKRWELTPTQKEMRDFCKKALPPYSVPSIFVALRALPVSEGTGKKLDTKALPGWDEANKMVAETEKEIQVRRRMAGVALEGGGDAAADSDQADPFQSTVAAIWRQICGIDANDVASSISPSDSFFDVGGSSLKLAEVARFMSVAAGAQVAIREIVGDPSLAAMAGVLSQATASSKGAAAKVVTAWRSLLDISPETELTLADAFEDHGGHSLKLALVAGSLGYGLTVKDLVNTQTVGGMTLAVTNAEKAAAVVRSRSDSEAILDDPENKFVNFPVPATIDLPAEANLEVSIYPAPSRRSNSRFRYGTAAYAPRRIFLTGATGYLGAFLMWEFAVKRGLPTYALVRAGSDEEAQRRLVETLRKYEMIGEDDDPDSDDCSEELDLFMHHCLAVPGDLSSPLLGMEPGKFKMVAGQIDAIVHCGADVNLFKPYIDLKKTNVLGVQEALRMATTNGLDGEYGASFSHVKGFFHVSSNGIFPSGYEGDRMEDADLEGNGVWGGYHDGYGMTKWVGEAMVRESQMRGLPAAILRPGNMSASTETGVWNGSDFYSLFLRAVIAMGAAPAAEEMDELGWELDMTPVDWAAAAIAKSVCEPNKSLGRVLHVGNCNRAIKMSDAVTMLEDAGWRIPQRVTVTEWSEKCTAGAAHGDEVLLKCSIAFDSFALYFGTGGKTGGKFDTKNMEMVMDGEGERCPKITKEYLVKALGWCGVEVPE